MEDDIVTRLARTLDLKMTDIEAAKAARLRPNNPDAEDLALQCLARFNDNSADARDPVKHPEIYEACEEALRLDPGNTRALKSSRRPIVRILSSGAGRTAEVARLDALVQKALAVDPNDGNARFAKGFSTSCMAATMKPLSSSSALIASDPSNIGVLRLARHDLHWAGEEEKAIAVFDKAMRLSPHDPNLPNFAEGKALALGVLGRDAEASAL